MDDLYKLMERYEDMVTELQPAIDTMNRLKKEIQNQVKELGEDVTHGNVSAVMRKGYQRVTWDSKELNGYAMAHPELFAFRNETWVKPSVAVKVAK